MKSIFQSEIIAKSNFQLRVFLTTPLFLFLRGIIREKENKGFCCRGVAIDLVKHDSNFEGLYVIDIFVIVVIFVVVVVVFDTADNVSSVVPTFLRRCLPLLR